MKKRTLPIWMLGLFFVPATMTAQEYKDGYIKWWSGTSETTFPNLVSSWSKTTPTVSEDDNFFISRVKPKARFRNQATQVRSDITETNDKRLVAWLPVNIPGRNALPDGVFDSEVFSMWQYVNHWGNWNCPLGRIPAALLDVAHKNGVAVSSVAGIPYGYLNNAGWINYLRAYRTLDANKAADFMSYFGYDGLGYNSEYNDYTYGVTAYIRQAHVNMVRAIKERNPIFENMWYDGTNDEGYNQFDNGLGYHNRLNFGAPGSEAASLFFNYNWTGATLLSNSVDYATQMGRDPLYLYAGVNMQGGEPKSGINWNLLKDHRISIGLWGAHSQNMFFEGRGEMGSAPEVKQRTYLLKTEQWFTGGSRNPAALPPMRNDLNHSVTNTKFPGMSSMMTAKSTLSWDLATEPFITYFNLGNGKFFNWKGERKTNRSWYNVGVQDYLPTWRWWFANDLLSTNVASNGLKAEFIWSDAYVGGSCMRVYGSTSDEYLHLFKTQYAMQEGDKITLRYKLVDGRSNANLVLTAKGAETVAINEESFNVLTTTQKTDDVLWVEKSFVVGSELAGKDLALVALHFTQTTNLDIYLGEFSIVRNVATTPQTPVITRSSMLAFNKQGMDAKLIWNMPNDKPSGEPCYNLDVNTAFFKLYAQQENGEEQLIGITTSWAGMFYSIPVDFTNSSHRMRLGVSAVALDHKTESAIAWTEYKDPVSYVYSNDIEVNKKTIKPNESFTIKFVDPRHTVANWTLTNAQGTVVASATGTTEFSVPAGLSNEGMYNLTVTGDVYASNGTVTQQARTFGGYIAITSESQGALPQIYTLTANGGTETVTVEPNAEVNMAYTGRPANGTLSRGVDMKEFGMALAAAEAGMSSANRAMSMSFWVKFNTIPAGAVQFVDLRDQTTGWPQNNWGCFWSTYDPAAKELQLTIRNTNTGGTEFQNWWDMSLTPGVWTHVAITFESIGGGIRPHLYINGVKVAQKRYKYGGAETPGAPSFGQATTAWWSKANFLFGFGRHQCAAWDAVIDDVKFFLTTLTDEQVAATMYKADASDSPLNFWNFETNADENYNFSGIGTSPSLALARVTVQKMEGEGQGSLLKSEPLYEAGSPFVAGTAWTVTTTPAWKAPQANVTNSTGDGSQGSATVSYVDGGDYFVTLTLANSFGSDSRTYQYIKVSGTTAIGEVSVDELKSYTVDKDIYVEFADAGNYGVQVYNLQGALIANTQNNVVAGSKVRVHVGTAGVYVLKVVKDGKTVRAAKLLCK